MYTVLIWIELKIIVIHRNEITNRNDYTHNNRGMMVISGMIFRIRPGYEFTIPSLQPVVVERKFREI